MDALRQARKGLRRNTVESDDSGHDSVAGSLADNAAFNTKALPGRREEDGPSKTQRVKAKARTLAHVTAHPLQAAKQRATKQIIANERPWLEDQAAADEALLDAHDTLDHVVAQPIHAAGAQRTEHTIGEATERMQAVEDDREEVQAAWHLARYVRRARVVRRPVTLPPTARYRLYDSEGHYERFNWIKWIGHLVIYGFQDAALFYVEPTNAVSFDREVLTRQVERLLVASQTFQLWWMRVRRVYTWEDPWLTFKWLLLFLALLKTGYFMSCYWSYLLYSVVTNFYGRHTRTWMRESTNRTNRTQERASMLSELIVRHGADAWLEPFLDEFGPWIQLQIGDVADFLEISAHYYDWRNLSSTAATCITYAVLVLVSAVPSLEFSIKIFWLSCGLFFFISRPIASNYPRFRHVLDPVRWMYWYSPTNAEASFAYLRRQAVLSAQKAIDADLDDHDYALEDDHDHDETFFDCTSTLPVNSRPTHQHNPRALEKTIMSFPARWSGQRGTLQICRSTARFVSSTTHLNPLTPSSHSTHWDRPLTDLLEVRKTLSPPSKLPSTGKRTAGPAALSILWAPQDNIAAILTTEEIPNDEEHCEEDLLYGMDSDRRDEAFNALIGISGALWMALQPEAAWQGRTH